MIRLIYSYVFIILNEAYNEVLLCTVKMKENL